VVRGTSGMIRCYPSPKFSWFGVEDLELDLKEREWFQYTTGFQRRTLSFAAAVRVVNISLTILSISSLGP